LSADRAAAPGRRYRRRTGRDRWAGAPPLRRRRLPIPRTAHRLIIGIIFAGPDRLRADSGSRAVADDQEHLDDTLYAVGRLASRDRSSSTAGRRAGAWLRRRP